jgi:large subunit ribosomal protein L15
LVNRWINVRDLDAVFAKHGKTDERGKVVLDLKSLGYDKLLGGGNVNGAFTVQVPKVSERAKAKIEAVGGEVVSANEHGNY